VPAEQVEHVLRVAAAEDRVEEPAVGVAVAELSGTLVLVGVTVRSGGLQVQRQPDRPRQPQRAVDLERPGVAKQQVMRGTDRLREVLLARRVPPCVVADVGGDPRFVERDPVRDAVAERPEHGRRVVGEAFGGLARAPATQPGLERLRQVPVVERGHRHDVALEEAVDEPCVEVEAALVQRPGAIGVDPRPGDAEPVRAEADIGHAVEVLAPAVVVVAGDVAGVAVLGRARRVAEPVPDRLAPAVLADRPFDLVGGRGGTPQEAIGEGHAVSPASERMGIATIADFGIRTMVLLT
jgi:hypothetical protein